MWAVITDVPNYPAWWPQFVRTKRLNALDGVGATVRVRVKSALPYWMHFQLELVEQGQPRVSVVNTTGDLVGWMRWELSPTATGTRLHFREEVRTGKRLLNVLAPLFKPTFAWNHRIMMRHGLAGLRLRLRERSPRQPVPA